MGWQQLLLPGKQPILQLRQQRRGLLTTQFQALCDGGILALPLDSIERTHPLDRLPGDLGSGLLRLDDLSFHMRPTPGARDRIADHNPVVAQGNRT